MNRGFVITGILFGLALILLISTNYVLLSERSTDYLVLQTDAVHNRAVDVKRIINEAIADGECSNLDILLEDTLLDSEGVTVTINSIDLTACPEPLISLSIDSANVHKEFTY